MIPLYGIEQRKRRSRIRQARQAGKLRRQSQRDDSFLDVWPVFTSAEMSAISRRLEDSGIAFHRPAKAMAAGGEV